MHPRLQPRMRIVEALDPADHLRLYRNFYTIYLLHCRSGNIAQAAGIQEFLQKFLSLGTISDFERLRVEQRLTGTAQKKYIPLRLVKT